MWPRRKLHESLTEGERSILGRLLSGNSPGFRALQEQLKPPFHLGVSRFTPRSKQPYRTAQNEFVLAMVYDGNLVSQFSIDYALNLEISDLWIEDRRIANPIHVVGHVHKGVLGTVVFQAAQNVKWPKHLRLDDDWFTDQDGRTVADRAFKIELGPDRSSSRIEDLTDSHLRAQFLRSQFLGAPTAVFTPIDASGFDLLTSELPSVDLPQDFKSFLEQTNGGVLFGIQIYGSGEAYLQGERDESERYLVISQNPGGRPICLDVKGGGVVLIEENTDPLQISSTFGGWLCVLEEEWNGA